MTQPKLLFCLGILELLSTELFAQKTYVSDSTWSFPFQALQSQPRKRILVDRYHKTIYTRPKAEQASEVMFQLARKDGFQVRFTDQELVAENLRESDMLIIAGLPNDRVVLGKENGKETVFWKSPLADREVESIARWTAAGGRLMLFLSHYPNGSGGNPCWKRWAYASGTGGRFARGPPQRRR
jgi:hypothetical protein